MEDFDRVTFPANAAMLTRSGHPGPCQGARPSRGEERLSTIALIMAAGSGDRLGGERPKQYWDLGGRPVLAHSLAAFARHPGVDAVRAVIRGEDRDAFEDAAAAAGTEPLDPAVGGETRQESVRLGLESLGPLAPARVLIHDGARPLVSAGVISRTLAALDGAPGAIAAVPVRDTLKRSAGALIEGTLDRTGLWRAQTPQGFRYAEILRAHRDARGLDLTDDAAVAERDGIPVALVEDGEDNLKITTAQDLARAERILGGGADVRVGSGFDVHRFGPGEWVTLCGIQVPHARGLEAHSDGDVALHAVADALLGTVGAGDIGTHFPPGDARWEGAESGLFVGFAMDRIREIGGRVTHLDLTIICEAPRIGPHREAMVARLAELLAVGPDHINVKATTTEGLGFTGRGEGIAAHATATVRAPSRPGGPDN